MLVDLNNHSHFNEWMNEWTQNSRGHVYKPFKLYPQVADGPWRHPDTADPAQQSDAEQDVDMEAEALGHDGPEHGEDGAGEPGPKFRPTSKTELQKLREGFQNTMGFVSHLYRDVSLKDEFQIVYIATSAYLEEYSDTLAAQKESQARNDDENWTLLHEVTNCTVSS